MFSLADCVGPGSYTCINLLISSSGVEDIMEVHPELINLKDDDGCTPLHVATLQDHNCDIATYIMQQVFIVIRAHMHVLTHCALPLIPSETE